MKIIQHFYCFLTLFFSYVFHVNGDYNESFSIEEGLGSAGHNTDESLIKVFMKSKRIPEVKQNQFPVTHGHPSDQNSPESNPIVKLIMSNYIINSNENNSAPRILRENFPRFSGSDPNVILLDKLSVNLSGNYVSMRSIEELSLGISNDGLTQKSYQDHSTVRFPRDVSLKQNVHQDTQSLLGSNFTQMFNQNDSTLRFTRGFVSKVDVPQSKLDFLLKEQPLYISSREDKDEESLLQLLSKIIFEYLYDCNLIIIVGMEFQKSRLLQMLVRFRNPKQVVFITSSAELAHQITWTSTMCQGTLLLSSDAKTIADFGNESPFLWDYRARVIIAGLSEEALEEFFMTTKGRKTEHIIGIVKSGRERQFRILTNPLLSRGKMIEVTSWRGNSFKNRIDLFPRMPRDLAGMKMNVITFEWQPAIIYQRDEDGQLLERYGSDISIVETLAETFNFTIVFKEPHPDELWGVRLPNGSYNGMVGLLDSGEGDLGIANVFLTAVDQQQDFMEYSNPFADDQGCYLARVDPPLPRWHSPVLPFQLNTWLVLLVGLALAGPILYLLSNKSYADGSEDANSISLTNAILYTFGIHFNSPMTKVPKCSSLRVFLCFLLIYSIIITTAYKSNLTAFFTITRQPRSIETFKDLYDSGLRVLGVNYDKVLLQSSENNYLRALTGRFDVKYSFNAMKQDVIAGKAVAMSNRRFLKLAIAQISASRGKGLVRIMKECFSSNTVGIGYQKHSPLKPEFDKAITRMFESGIVTKWFLDSISRDQQLQTNKPDESEVPEDAGKVEEDGSIPLSMDHMQGVFFLLAFGCAFSTLLFSVEVLFG